MRKLILILAVLSVIGFTSCKRNIYREFHEFENYQWGRFDKITFKFSVKDDGTMADIILSVRHLEQFPYDKLPVNIIMTLPSGEERIVEKEISLKDQQGKFIGEVAGSYWDVQEVLWKGFFFNKAGEYTIELENLNPRPAIPYIVDLGLIVKK
ncbi:MAG: hypothetical protein ACM3ME_00455 [Chloroflexota bacterium]|nr:hypothetical protein [Lentimicrobium sp.]